VNSEPLRGVTMTPMRALRSLRRVIALTTLVGWAMLQVAVTVYACPMDAAPSMSVAAMADSDASGDVAPPCGEHCSTQHSIGPSLLPTAMPAVPLQPPIWVAPAPIVAATYQATRQHVERRKARGDPVPLSIKLQVFRE
jgi:hypothetical protein